MVELGDRVRQLEEPLEEVYQVTPALILFSLSMISVLFMYPRIPVPIAADRVGGIETSSLAACRSLGIKDVKMRR